MKGTDLKLTAEDATRALGREVVAAIERIRQTGAELAEQLATASTVIKPVDIASAEIAGVIDFTQYVDTHYRTQMQLSFGGCGGGYVDLINGIRHGRYRALILVERLGD